MLDRVVVVDVVVFVDPVVNLRLDFIGVAFVDVVVVVAVIAVVTVGVVLVPVDPVFLRADLQDGELAVRREVVHRDLLLLVPGVVLAVDGRHVHRGRVVVAAT